MPRGSEFGVDVSRWRLRSVAAVAAAMLALVVVLLGPAVEARAAESDTILALTNQSRAAAGLGPLSRDGAMDQVALNWAGQMAASGAMSHNPSFSAQIPGGWSNAAENVAQGHPNGAAMHQGWMDSPGHRANILGDYTAVGTAFVSVGGTTWGVQVFGKYGASVAAPAPAPPAAAPLPAQAPAPPPAPVPAPAPAPPAPAPSAAELAIPTSGNPPAELEAARHEAGRVAVLAELRADVRLSNPESARAASSAQVPVPSAGVFVGLAGVVVASVGAVGAWIAYRRRTSPRIGAPST